MERICSTAAVRGNAARAWLRRSLLVVATASVPAIAHAQSMGHGRPPAWEFTIALGGYARGNGAAVASWLRHNAYGTPEPKHCGFDFIFRTVCDNPVAYPQTSDVDVIGWTLGVGRTVTDHLSIDVFGATEQSGTVVGRCDDLATPKDVRCTDRFMRVEFGGASVAALGVVNTGHLHVGAGPAVLFANWDMSPAHLPGLWLDATYSTDRIPVFAHAQYRVYRSASFAPSQHFTGFHPSTLYLGMGFTIRVDDSPR